MIVTDVQNQYNSHVSRQVVAFYKFNKIRLDKRMPDV